MFRSIVFIFYVLIFLVLLCFIILFIPGPLNKDILITIDKGENTFTISKALVNQNVIRNQYFFAYSMRLLGLDKRLVVGEFPIYRHASLARVISTLIDSRKIYFRKITIPEGFTVKEIYKLLNDNPYLTGLLPENVLEGTLLPETYYFATNETRVSIINRMHEHMIEYVNNLWKIRDQSLPYNYKEDALIVASMIEKEATISSEKKIIAGVFLNRLRLKMRLQSDPTVAYGLHLPKGKPLSRRNLSTKTPYNTYIISGLPIGPIANPGKESIEAAFYPAKTKYLYFVANGTGGHTFSSTLQEHNMAVLVLRKIEHKRQQNKK